MTNVVLPESPGAEKPATPAVESEAVAVSSASSPQTAASAEPTAADKADSPALGILYTAGYGNAQPEDFFAGINRVSISLALDIRLKPWGWHQLYRKEAFLRALETEGGAARAKWTERLGNVGKFSGGEMALSDPTAVADLVSMLARGRNVLIICGCGKYETCHRTMVARLARELAPELIVENLPTPAKPKPARGEAATTTSS